MNVLNLNLIYVDPSGSTSLPDDFVSLVNAFSNVAGLKLIDFKFLDRNYKIVPCDSSFIETEIGIKH